MLFPSLVPSDALRAQSGHDLVRRGRYDVGHGKCDIGGEKQAETIEAKAKMLSQTHSPFDIAQDPKAYVNTTCLESAPNPKSSS